MIIDQKRTLSVARGQWCNLCGTRLAGNGWSLPFARRTHRSGSAYFSGNRAFDTEYITWSVCVQCYEKRLRCAACGVPVGAQAFMIEGDRQFYCPECFEQRPRCDTCDRPVGTRYWTRPDGRKLCDRCQSTAVADSNAAHALWRRVRESLAKELGMTLKEPCQLKLVSRNQLISMLEKSSLHTLDSDSRGRCFGLFLQQGNHKAIFIEYGLPQIVLLEVMAHEFAHAWQSEHTPMRTSLEVQEGFAEWVAYKLLHSWGCYRRSDRMLRRDDLYGHGLQMVLSWEQEGGKAEVFRRIRTAPHVSG